MIGPWSFISIVPHLSQSGLLRMLLVINFQWRVRDWSFSDCMNYHRQVWPWVLQDHSLLLNSSFMAMLVLLLFLSWDKQVCTKVGSFSCSQYQKWNQIQMSEGHSIRRPTITEFENIWSPNVYYLIYYRRKITSSWVRCSLTYIKHKIRGKQPPQ